ncbi:MTH1187 family thiamine-binding protein [Geosporobacter ferrireducens]|uniref:Thiamine-binding protein domain-containing protein n=1 Tax=Geosporobacter ferrireducens TaxID=1424294 RepID=A0A1D8GC38_9FIRM|nr:MTH1187 family thiamine-binding protein [Geosporobacter ferrireducens]AOT68479.1 hypothetical protein Gferi_02055 [Geosporobacter ferrireducens]
MAIVETSIVPLGTGDTSISHYVAACHCILQAENRVNYELTAMGTIIEGDLDIILDVIRRMHEVPFESGALRVSTTIKIDDRRDRRASMAGKTQAVTDKLKK